MRFPHLTIHLLIGACTLSGCAGLGSTPSASSTDGVRSEGRSDSELASTVKDAFKQDAQLSGASIDVTADQGVVRLSGRVNSPQAYNRAISLARSVTGRPPVAADLTFSP